MVEAGADVTSHAAADTAAIKQQRPAIRGKLRGRRGKRTEGQDDGGYLNCLRFGHSGIFIYRTTAEQGPPVEQSTR